MSSIGRVTSNTREGSALAQACDHANLTRAQREAVGLAAQGYPLRAIAAALSLSYRQARQVTRSAERKLRSHHGYLLALDRRFLKSLFACLRNIRPAGSGRLHVYAPLPGGGHDDQPLGMPARPEGEHVEDLMQEPGRFLRALPWLLAQHAREGGRLIADELAQCAVTLCG